MIKLTGETTIYRKDFDKPSYSISISKKKEDGTWINTFLPVNFRKGVSVGNKTKVTINDSWLSCYEGKNGNVMTLFINDFDTELPAGFEEVDDIDIPFA